MKRTSRQLCNMSTRREDGQGCGKGRGRESGEGRAAGAGEPTLVHVNGIYIKAAQISSWVLNVRGSKKPFRHAASPRIVKIEGALVLCSCGLCKGGGDGRADGGRRVSSQFRDFVKANAL